MIGELHLLSPRVCRSPQLQYISIRPLAGISRGQRKMRTQRAKIPAKNKILDPTCLLLMKFAARVGENQSPSKAEWNNVFCGQVFARYFCCRGAIRASVERRVFFGWVRKHIFFFRRQKKRRNSTQRRPGKTPPRFI